MATLKEAIQYASQNPDSDFAKFLTSRVMSGQADTEAKMEGIDLTPIKSSFSSVEPSSLLPPTKKQGIVSKTISGIGGLMEGAFKGVAGTVTGLANLGETVLNQSAGRVFNAIQGKDFTPTEQNIYGETGSLEKSLAEKGLSLKPEGMAENIGYGTEKLAEFLIPATKIAKAENTLSLLSSGSGFLPAAGRVGIKSAVSGLSTGAIGSAQTGSFKEGAKMGLTGGIIRGGLATIGEGARAVRLPEKLYSTIFKNSVRDVKESLTTEGLALMQKQSPERYKELLQKGIVKLGANGEVIVNDTLAKEALDRGLRGSIKNMAYETVRKTAELEDEAQTIARTYTKPIKVNEKQFLNVLNKIKSDYGDVGFGEVSDEANRFIKLIKSGKGMLNAEDTLSFRRFLDGMRVRSSYNPITNLSTTQQNFKTLSDTVRGRLVQIPGMKNTMNEYRFYIEAMETLAKEAQRRGNNQLFSLIDSIFLGGGLLGQSAPAGMTLFGLRKFIQSGIGATGIANALNRTQSTALGTFATQAPTMLLPNSPEE